MKISTFTLKGKDINLLFERGSIGYQFTENEKSYGHKVKLPKKATKEDIANVIFLLITNYLETIETL